MLGVLPLQKPDAYIHFAPKKRMELKYCISISATVLSREIGPNVATREQFHFGTQISTAVGPADGGQGIKWEPIRLGAGARFRGTPFPELFDLAILGSPLKFVYVLDALANESTNRDFSINHRIFAPFGVSKVKIPQEPNLVLPIQAQSSSWVFVKRTSLKSVAVIHVSRRTLRNPLSRSTDVNIVDFWLNSEDSSVERCETTLPATEGMLGGSKLVITRIR